MSKSPMDQLNKWLEDGTLTWGHLLLATQIYAKGRAKHEGTEDLIDPIIRRGFGAMSEAISEMELAYARGNRDSLIPPLDSTAPSPTALREIEADAIQRALTLNGGNREATAKMLRIGERTLYRKIKVYKLEACIRPYNRRDGKGNMR